MNLIKARIAKHLGIKPEDIREVRDWEPKGIYFVIIAGRRPTFVSRKNVLATTVEFTIERGGIEVAFTVNRTNLVTIKFGGADRETTTLTIARRRWQMLANAGYQRVA
jgi:hypothetical protein